MQRPRFLALVLALALVVTTAYAGPAKRVSERRQRQSAELAQHAAMLLARGTLEARRTARGELERAVLLDPGNSPAAILLGRWYESAKFDHAARMQFLHVLDRDSQDPDARAGLARLWRHDWLRTSDETSLDSALAQLERATSRVGGVSSRLWVMEASLRAEQGDVPAALAAAGQAVRVDSTDGESWMTWAAMRWLSGDAEGADSAFGVAFERLPARVRGRFSDVSPLADERETEALLNLRGDPRDDFTRRFWVRLDPDPTTWENEARLEYWSRVARAYLLFWAPARRAWDDRGEAYVRYGPPERVIANPVQSFVQRPASEVVGHLVWSYPKYRVGVPLYDTHMMENFEFATARDHVRADSIAVERAGCELIAHGRAVVPRVPPGLQPISLRTQLARFPAGTRSLLASWLEVPGGPSSDFVAECIVLDSTQRVVARQRSGTGPSGCAADAYRVADFTSALAPGDYLVGMSISAPGRRGSVTRHLHVPAPDTSLALGDLVVTCGTPTVPDSSVRLSPNPAGRVRPSEPLTVYFELHRLQLDHRGHARFEYSYVVRPRAQDRRGWISRWILPHPEVLLQMRQVEDHAGSVRRQFLRVPIRALPDGEYRLELEALDLVANRRVSGSADFVVSSADEGAHPDHPREP